MNIEKIKEEGDTFLIQINGGTLSFVNLLKEELWNDSNVQEAAAIKDHPYMAEPKLLLKMKGKSNPRTAIGKSIKRVENKLKDFDKEFRRALKG